VSEAPAPFAAGVSGASKTEQEIAYLAYHDALTALPNRTLLEDHLDVALARAEAQGEAVALVYIDLNDFKPVNDELGHAAGDELLRQVAERLLGVVGYGELLARVGGDEFLLMLPGIAPGPDADLRSAARARAVGCAQQIADELQASFRIAGADLQIHASVGTSTYPFDAQDAETLARRADAAMYEAKASGGGWSAYEAKTTDPLQRLALAARLRRAVTEGEVELYYQPVFDLLEGNIHGVEALARWRNSSPDFVPAAEFVRAAEQSGVIDALGDWVLDQLCRQGRAWLDIGLAPGLAINVSPRQLRRAGFARTVIDTVRGFGLDPGRIIIELPASGTELAQPRITPVLDELAASGFTLALDHFGAGHSSLADLWDLPVSIIKVDGIFLRKIPAEPQAKALVSGILQIVRAYGRHVVVEGIETEAQRTFLVEQGCRLGQGFHLGKPLAATETTALLEAQLLPNRRRNPVPAGGAEPNDAFKADRPGPIHDGSAPNGLSVRK
jgi:diguanylate cyclase (GGDEF)-like protein